jgi:hypothetical protein
LVVEGYGGVGGQDHLRWGGAFGGEFSKDSFGFFAGEADDVGDGVFVGKWVLGYVGGMNLEGVSGLGEKFAATWRGGGEDKHELIMTGDRGEN